MKKLLILGGSTYIVPVIEIAHELGLYVITCDYLPDNVAHKYSDEYWNISIIDTEKVLDAANEAQINGIISFACDPGVVTAAYVAECMGLPFQCSYKSASILQDKGLFRQFLLDNGFKSPMAKRYTDKKLAVADKDIFNWPVIVKPVDSAGSKGVNKAENISELEVAIDIAIGCSHNSAFIVEEFLTFEGFHSSADPFTVNGKLQFITYSDQLFDKQADNPYTPAYIIWPSTMKEEHQKVLTSETQRLMDLLGMKNGIYNIESCVSTDGVPYIMEVSPRGGGCRIAELQKKAFGVDLIKAEILKAIDEPIDLIPQDEIDGVWCEMVVHAKPGQSGVLKEIKIAQDILEKYVVDLFITAKPGDYIKPFTGANMSLGDLFLKCKDRNELNKLIEKTDEWIDIILE